MYAKKIKKNVLYFLLLVISSVCTEGSFAFDKHRVLEAATLEYPPYQYIENNQAKGIAVEIIKEAIRRTGVNGVNFSFYPWNRAVLMTKTGHSDILFNAGKNKERQQWGEYVESTLIQQKYVLFKIKDSSFSVSPDLNNEQDLIIAIRLGYLYGSGKFRQSIDTGKFKNVIFSKSTEQSVAILLSKKADLFVGDYLPVMHYLKKNGLLDKIDIVSELGTTDILVVLKWPTYILFSKKTISKQYVDEVNTVMEQMKLDGTYQRIYSKYVNF